MILITDWLNSHRDSYRRKKEDEHAAFIRNSFEICEKDGSMYLMHNDEAIALLDGKTHSEMIDSIRAARAASLRYRNIGHGADQA
jgi:hypothetical protein